MRISIAAIRHVAHQFGDNLDPAQSSRLTYIRRFRSYFGINPCAAANLWNSIDCDVTILNAAEVEWFLAALYFLRVYPTVTQLANTMGRDEKTVRKHVWKYTDLIGSLEVVCTVSELNIDDLPDSFPHAKKLRIQRKLTHLRASLNRIENHLEIMTNRHGDRFGNMSDISDTDEDSVGE